MMAAFQRTVTIWFDGDRAVIPVDQLAADCGVSVSDVDNTIEKLVTLGALAPRPDGSYEATIPAVAHG